MNEYFAACSIISNGARDATPHVLLSFFHTASHYATKYLVISTCILFSLVSSAATTPEIRMRVVESGSGKPIAGAQVRYGAMAREGTLSGHGGRSVPLFEIVAESAADGAINIPSTSFDANLFGILGMNTNYENATMSIAREGYVTLQLRNSLRIIPNLDEVTVWEHNGKTVELQPGKEDPNQALLERFKSFGGARAVPSIMPMAPTVIRKRDDSALPHQDTANPR